MKKFALIGTLLVLLMTAGIGAATALADKPPSPPGKDPCSHGNTGKPCKPDPQPDKGKDCEKHGKEGGVNEDHCLGETNPPPTTTETTTTTETGTTSSPTVPGQTIVTETTPTVVVPVAPVPPVVKAPDKKPVTKKALEKDLEEQAKKNGASSQDNSPAAVQAPGTLPRTGLPLWAYTLFGFGMIGSGLIMKRL